MNGTLSQIILLVGQGNSFLSGGGQNAPDLLRLHPLCSHVVAFKFVRYSSNKADQGQEIASSTSAWYQRLQAEGAERFWYINFDWKRHKWSEHQAAGFHFDGISGIQVDYPIGFELWYPFYGRKENVECNSLRFDHSQVITVLDLQAVREQLRQAVESARAFLEKAGGPNHWAGSFAEALQLLDAIDPLMPWQCYMLPANCYSLSARQLFAAAMKADLFGGMMSWNDTWFADRTLQPEYQQASDQLWNAVQASYLTSANALDEKLMIELEP